MIVYRKHGHPTLVDREALALLTQRSIHTIRLRCTVVRHHYSGRALYDLDVELTRLKAIPTRRRDEDRAAG